MSEQIALGVGVFCLTYIVIISEKLNRTAVAFSGAALMLILNILDQTTAFDYIDFSTIFLLVGMMIIVGILKRTGIFEYSAIRIAKISKGDPWKIIVFFSLFTAVSSAFLDNVTTILLVAPVTLVIANSLKLNPLVILLPEVFMANIGGTATLIGDPPNIMIGSATGLGFLDFMFNLAPVIIIISIVTLFIIKFIFAKSLKVEEKSKKEIMLLDEKLAIRDKKLLVKSLIVLGLTVIGFIIHAQLGYESATIALAGAALLMLISNLDPEEVLHEIEWPTVFFFAALFILVGALEELGVIHFLAMKLLDITQGNAIVTTLVILWSSAILSSFLDNIPFVATMIPLIQSMEQLGTINVGPLWWALALGACLGGNGTLVGASANVIVGGFLEKHGHKITFLEFMKLGFPIMLVSIAISTIYMVVVYF